MSSSCAMTTARLEPLADHAGVRVHAGAVARFEAADYAAVNDLLHRKQVLSFPGQSLTPAELVRFGRAFGDLQLHVLQEFTLPGFPEIYVLSNEVADGRRVGNPKEGYGWHTDMSYMRRTTAYTILYALKVPQHGGNTLFANAFAAYDALDPARQARLAGLRAVFSYRRLYGVRVGVTPLTDEQKAKTPDVLHPLVRTHPYTGRKGLYLGGIEVAGVDGMPDEAGMRLVAELLEFATQERFQLSYPWASGDLVIWDNRGLLHTASEYDHTRQLRTLHRVSVEGEEPA